MKIGASADGNKLNIIIRNFILIVSDWKPIQIFICHFDEKLLCVFM